MFQDGIALPPFGLLLWCPGRHLALQHKHTYLRTKTYILYKNLHLGLQQKGPLQRYTCRGKRRHTYSYLNTHAHTHAGTHIYIAGQSSFTNLPRLSRVECAAM